MGGGICWGAGWLAASMWGQAGAGADIGGIHDSMHVSTRIHDSKGHRRPPCRPPGAGELVSFGHVPWTPPLAPGPCCPPPESRHPCSCSTWPRRPAGFAARLGPISAATPPWGTPIVRQSRCGQVRPVRHVCIECVACLSAPVAGCCGT